MSTGAKRGPKPKAIPSARLAAAASLYRAGADGRAVATYLRVAPATAMQRLRDAGVSIRPRGWARCRKSPQTASHN